MIAVLALLCLQLRQQPQPMPDPVVELRAAFSRILAEKRFEPVLLPIGVFDSEKMDPLLIQAQWETVRPSLEKASTRFLRPGQPSLLCLHFQAIPNDPKKLMLAFHDQENVIVKAAMIGAFGLRESHFRRFHSKSQAFATVIGELDQRFMTNGKEPNLVRVFSALTDVFQSDANSFRNFQLSVLKIPNNPTDKKLTILTSWVKTGEITAPKRIRYFWRVHLELENFQDKGWSLKLVLDLGNQYAADSKVGTIGDSDSLANSDMPSASANNGTLMDSRAPSSYEMEQGDKGTGEIKDPINNSKLIKQADAAFRLCVEKVMKKEPSK